MAQAENETGGDLVQLALFEGRPVHAFRGSLGGRSGDFELGEQLKLGDEIQIQGYGRVVKVTAHERNGKVTRQHVVSVEEIEVTQS